MNGIFDYHAHYDDERFDADRDELLQRIHREGVEYIMTIGSDLASSRAACRLAERYDFIWFAAGIHPEQAGDAPADYREALKELAAHPKCQAIGEIGLDYYWAENPPRERQQVLFREQVLLAKELGLPVIIHDREAHADTLEVLRELRPAGVLHCFSGSAEMAGEVAALGMYIGFTGAITFKNARKAPQAAGQPTTSGPVAASAYPTDCAKPESRAASTASPARKPISASPMLKAQPLARPRMAVAAICTPAAVESISIPIPMILSTEPSSSQPR